MAYIKICESDNWIIDYDKERGMYRVSYFEDGHFVDEWWFDEYKEEDKSLQKIINEFCATPSVNPISPEELRKVLKRMETMDFTL